MKAAFSLLYLIGLVVAFPTDLAADLAAEIPSCPMDCVIPAVGQSGCELHDLLCMCNPEAQAKVRNAAAPCFANCVASDIAAAEGFISSVCQ
ncbi:Extracellular membrane protein, CFEM domain protein [Cordyceps fumosorosea ARSEF 2679]|uniref:Extracellular membrane protein, CFEM domain protein n=1 Tax=Cordyceps fumosorosea (strain ARSEF 2679) TaxID=1081104 RepID=A0A167UF82_CORFA|nr:Extracellular membrane protein, CFEM domain protein [Cordyceps fumosorosea ARSEF 2679]OAA61527.1 Extracellular membrane protein, CFEM domain protein [Cordyceps fumosorosea ARSEF 2679]